MNFAACCCGYVRASLVAEQLPERGRLTECLERVAHCGLCAFADGRVG